MITRGDVRHFSLSSGDEFSTRRACTMFFRNTSAMSIVNVIFSSNAFGSVVEASGRISLRNFSLKAA